MSVQKICADICVKSIKNIIKSLIRFSLANCENRKRPQKICMNQMLC